jgi:hypothetical protein
MTGWPFLLIAALYASVPAVTISIAPPFSLAPATFRITVIVPRHPDNRKICFSVEGPEMKRSCEDLPGFEARRTWTVYWSLRTAGEYQAEAELTRMESGKAQHYRDVRSFRVLGME